MLSLSTFFILYTPIIISDNVPLGFQLTRRFYIISSLLFFLCYVIAVYQIVDNSIIHNVHFPYLSCEASIEGMLYIKHQKSVSNIYQTYLFGCNRIYPIVPILYVECISIISLNHARTHGYKYIQVTYCLLSNAVLLSPYYRLISILFF